MQSSNRNSGSGMLKFRGISGIVMGFVYILVGFLIVRAKGIGSTFEMSPTTSYIVGAVVILYGIFRIVRGAKTLRAKDGI